MPCLCRPDLTSRVLKLKLDELLADLTLRHILGRVTGYMYTIESQKHGLPHAHISLIMHPDDRPHTAADFRHHGAVQSMTILAL